MKKYGVFIRIDVTAESTAAAVEIAEKALSTISKPDGFEQWAHYEVEEG